jgi:hypothetical protein
MIIFGFLVTFSHLLSCYGTGIGIVLDRGHVIYGDGHFHHCMEYLISSFAAISRAGLSQDDVRWVAFHPMHTQRWRAHKQDMGPWINVMPTLITKIWPNSSIVHISKLDSRKT